MMKVFNYLARKVEAVKPLKSERVGMYTCGPTVYGFAHIGNLRMYTFEDVLKRTLRLSGYRVKHVMNITDVGHLTSDADTGEDKMAAAAKRERKTAWDVARFYEDAFKADITKLRIEEPDIWARATDHIKEQIDLVRTLEKKGFTYSIPNDGVYFDTAKLPDYGKLMPSRLKGLKGGARVEIAEGKRNATDFALWKLSPSGEKRDMEWDSPWGKGFPGWHIECSAMSMKYLGKSFDLHAGGIDHVPIHHTNEIAQSEAATGKPFVKYFVEGEFLLVDGGKMSKSLGNFYTLADVEAKGFDPLDFRFFTLQAHYRSTLNFTWRALEAARDGRRNIVEFAERLDAYKAPRVAAKSNPWVKKSEAFMKKFTTALENDLDTPKALALLFDFLRGVNPIIDKAKLSARDLALIKRALNTMESVFAIIGEKTKDTPLPFVVKALLEKREEYRKEKSFAKADGVRAEIEHMGYTIEDTSQGARVKRI